MTPDPVTPAQVTYDTRSGQIIGIYLGAVDAAHASERARSFSGYNEQHIDVIAVTSDAFAPGKHYRVDLGRKALIEADLSAGGIGFSFGRTTISASPFL